jgi:hypothetical protein
MRCGSRVVSEMSVSGCVDDDDDADKWMTAPISLFKTTLAHTETSVDVGETQPSGVGYYWLSGPPLSLHGGRQQRPT